MRGDVYEPLRVEMAAVISRQVELALSNEELTEKLDEMAMAYVQRLYSGGFGCRCR